MDEHEHHKKIDKYIRSVTNGDSHNNEEDEDRTGSDAPSEEVLDHPCVKGHKLRMFDDETKMFCRRCSFTKKTPDIAPACFSQIQAIHVAKGINLDCMTMKQRCFVRDVLGRRELLMLRMITMQRMTLARFEFNFDIVSEIQ
eukprot:369489_1